MTLRAPRSGRDARGRLPPAYYWVIVRSMSEEQSTSENTRAFRDARDFLIAHREDYDTAYRDFSWPAFDRFNWARDWFDALAVEQAEVAALTIVEEDGEVNSLTYAEMAERSRQVAGWLTEARAAAGRPGADRARQHRAAVGGDARLHPGRRGDDPRDDAADGCRPGRPDHPWRSTGCCDDQRGCPSL